MKALLFDLDGTLVDSLIDLANAMNHVLQSNGFHTHSLKDYRLFVGNGIKKLVERALPKEEKDNIDFYYQQMMEYYSVHYHDATHSYNGIKELLKIAKEKGYKMAVLSNKADAITRKIVEHIFPEDTFDIVQGALPNIPLKPNATSAKEIAKKLRINPIDFLYLGDTNIDILTAKTAGMHSVGCTWGFRSEKELKDAEAETIIHHPKELIDKL